MFGREKLNKVFAEFTGTLLLALSVLVVSHMFGLGTAAWYISLTAGVALMLIVAKLGHVSGAHVNPAVTIGLWTIKKINSNNAVVYIASQMLGGAVALLFYNYLINGSLAPSGSGEFVWRVFWGEAAGAIIFGAGIASAIDQKMEGFYKAFTIGASLAAGALLASVASAGYLNPAVALANNSWDKTLVVAPIFGIIVGMNSYMALFASKKKK